ncbi:hypothetical protein CsSME_00020798 [Camellia sinensis var. sinensis]
MVNENKALPNFLLSVKLKYVKLGYHYLISHAMYLLLMPLLAIVSVHLSTLEPRDLAHLWNHLKFNLVTVFLCSALLVFLATLHFMTRPRKIYLVNFACYKPELARMCSRELFIDRSVQAGTFTEENIAFQKKIVERSGLGQKTYLPEAVIRVLAKTGVKAKDIGIVIVNCSLFNPTPSLSAMVVNHYKLRGNVLSYSLGGMGCSAGLISIDLAKQLLQVCLTSLSIGTLVTTGLCLSQIVSSEWVVLQSSSPTAHLIAGVQSTNSSTPCVPTREPMTNVTVVCSKKRMKLRESALHCQKT